MNSLFIGDPAFLEVSLSLSPFPEISLIISVVVRDLPFCLLGQGNSPSLEMTFSMRGIFVFVLYNYTSPPRRRFVFF